jgi:hypothetical protein
VIAETHRGGRAVLAIAPLRLAWLPGLARRLALRALALRLAGRWPGGFLRGLPWRGWLLAEPIRASGVGARRRSSPAALRYAVCAPVCAWCALRAARAPA